MFLRWQLRLFIMQNIFIVNILFFKMTFKILIRLENNEVKNGSGDGVKVGLSFFTAKTIFLVT